MMCKNVLLVSQRLNATNLIDNQMHNCLWNDVTLRLVNNLQIRVNEIANRFHLTFQLWIQRR